MKRSKKPERRRATVAVSSTSGRVALVQAAEPLRALRRARLAG